MSTIFGIFNRNNKVVETNTIESMDKAFSYWKEDEKSIWHKDNIAIGHRMLWNTPESLFEHLPHVKKINNNIFVITSDSRIDNREILVKQLNLTDIPLKKITDSDLILAAYQMWGEDCPKYLLGDFVFAIWDADKEQLFCARDHIGIKSFYYHINDDLFVFSNDIRGVIAYPEISKKYNDRSIAMFLAGVNGFQDDKDTFFQSIEKLPAATCITITKEKISKSIYWDIENISEINYDTYADYVDQLRILLKDAVKVRLRSLYNVGSHISGGIDSAAISVLAARELEKRKQPLHAFSWIQKPREEYDPDYKEWNFITHIASIENIEQKNIKLTARFLANIYDKIDVTIDDTTYFWSECLVRDEANKNNVRTLLSGWGGDELISYNGHAYLSGLFCNGHFIKAIQYISDFYIHSEKKYKFLRIIKKSLKEFFHACSSRLKVISNNQEKLENDPYEFTKDHFSLFARTLSFHKVEYQPGVHNQQKIYFRYGHLLQRIENWGSSAFEKKLEYRYPLLDKRIVEFALSIPEDIYARKAGKDRYLFRRVISDFLPKDIVWEKKLTETRHVKETIKIWDEALILWMKKNKNIKDNGNNYIDRVKIMEKLNSYFIKIKEEENIQEKGISSETGVIASILLLNLKDRKS